MKGIWKKGVSFLVSLTLAVGLVPVPAFAEAADAVGLSGGEEQPAEGQDSTTEEVREPLKATTQSVDGNELDGEGNEGDGLGDEGDDYGDEGDEGLDDNEDGEGDDGGDGDIEAQEMILGESCSATIEAENRWYGQFTAAEAGAYHFGFDNFNVNVILYSTSGDSLDDVYESISDGARNLVYYMQADETVRFSLGNSGDETAYAEVSVTKADVDLNDLDFASLSLAQSDVEVTGDAVELEITVTTLDGREIDAEHYELCYADKDNAPLDSAPSELGEYWVCARAVEGCGYTGQTMYHPFSIYSMSPTDIGSDYWDREWKYSWNDFDYPLDCDELKAAAPSIYHYVYSDDGEEEPDYLTMGEDFEFAHFVDSDGREVEKPQYEGSYRIVYRGIGSYEGTASFEFTIVGGPASLSSGWVSLNQNMYSYRADNPVALDIEGVYDGDYNALSSDDYVLVYYSEGGTELSSAPTDVGDYYVAARATTADDSESAGYVGETAKASFSIVSDYDLRYGYNAWLSNSRFAPPENGIVLPEVTIVRESDEQHLKAGTDYKFDHFETSEGERIDGAPKAIGSYYAVYCGLDPYKGSISAWFEISDPHNLSYAQISVNDNDEGVMLTADGVAKPDVTVIDLAGKKLTEGVDYELRYRMGSENDDDDDGDDGDEGDETEDENGDDDEDAAGGYGEEGDEADDSGEDYGEDGEYDGDSYWDSGWDAAEPEATGAYYVAAFACENSEYGEHTDSASFRVYDPYDIGGSYWRSTFWPNSNVAAGSAVDKLPMALIYRLVDGDSDVHARLKSDNYELVGFKSADGSRSFEVSAGIPSESGDYYAVYQGKEPYRGERSMKFHAYSTRNIGDSSYWKSEFSGGSTLFTDGGPVELPKLQVYTADHSASLTEGVEFEFDHYEYAYSVYGDSSVLESAPATSGEYYAVYKAIESTDYTGEIHQRFTVRESYNLALASLSLESTTFASSERPVSPSVKVRDIDDVLLKQGEDYELVYYDKDGKQLSDAPHESGTYYLAARALSSGSYKGETDKRSFTIGQGESEVPASSEFANLELKKFVDAKPKTDGFWYAQFSAPEAGTFVFKSSGSADTMVDLYDSGDLDDGSWLAYDDDSGQGYNFLLVRELSKGDTVYLKVRSYDSDASFTVGVEPFDDKNLEYANIEVARYNIALVDGKAVPDVTVSIRGNEVPSDAYELRYRSAWDDRELDGVPSETGSYYVIATAKSENGSGYYGSTNSASFHVNDARDLAVATISLDESELEYTGEPVKPSVTVTDASGEVLDEGKDYELEYYQYRYDAYERLDSAPIDAFNDYLVKARAVRDGEYSGMTSSCGFEIVDPYDLESSGSVYLQDYLYYGYVNGARIPVYYSADSKSVYPEVSVWCDDGSLSADSYDVTYDENPVAGRTTLASVTVTGKEPYRGSLTLNYGITAKLNLEDCLASSTGCTLVAGSAQATYYPGNDRPQFLVNGGPIAPRVMLRWPGMNSAPEQGIDFTVSYLGADGKECIPSSPGKYRAAVKATAEGMCSGSVKIPFAIVETYELDRREAVPSLLGGGAFALDYSSSSTGSVSRYQFSDVLTNVGGFFWGLFSSGAALIENLDYTVSSNFNELTGLLTYVFTGSGGYAGTVRAEVYGASSSEAAFAERSAYASYASVDESGTLGTASVWMRGLTEGVDFECAGFEDAEGKQVTEAKGGDVVYVRVNGLGSYNGCSRALRATVRAEADVPDLANSGVFLLAGGMPVYNDGVQWYYKADLDAMGGSDAVTAPEDVIASNVALKVYGRETLLMSEGNGFTVEKKTYNPEKHTLALELVADADAPAKGSVTKTVNIVDKYPISFSRYLTVSGPSSGRTVLIGNNGTTDTVSLGYEGVSYVPQVVFPALNSMAPQAEDLKVSISGESGKLDAITGAGSYTLHIEGTGDWGGTIDVPLVVTPSTAGLDGAANLANCTMVVGSDAGLVDGKAEPTVEVFYAGTKLEKGTDYQLVYGNNEQAGARAWVKAVPVENGRFNGSCAANFTVAGGEYAELSTARYQLYLQTPSGSYEPVDDIRVYSGSQFGSDAGEGDAAASAGPAVKVMSVNADGIGAELDSSCYKVTYSDTSKLGMNYVKVTGNADAGYSGMLSANFYVLDSKQSQAITAEDKTVQVDMTVKLDAKVDSGEDGSLTFESRNDQIAIVDEQGVVTGKKAGTAQIIITAPETDTYKRATKIVTVTVKNGQAITASDKDVQVSKTVSLGASAKTALSYASSDTKVATVSEKGVVTGKKAGKATITITAAETDTYMDAIKTVTVTVKNGQTITANGATVQVGKNVSLGASAKTALSYASSDTKVATVSEKGVVVGKKAGTAKITITAAATTSYMGATKTVTITVKNANPLATKAASKNLSFKTLKSKPQAFTPALIKKKGQGKVTYSQKSVTAKYKKYVSVNSGGKVTVKKGAPKGKCSLVVNVKAAGYGSYLAATKTATVTINVR